MFAVPVVDVKNSLITCFLASRIHELKTKKIVVYTGIRTLFHTKFLALVANRPFAAKPSRDLLFIKLWAKAYQMPEMEKACQEYQDGQI